MLMHVSSNISIVHLKHTAFQVCDSTNETAINVFYVFYTNVYKWGGNDDCREQSEVLKQNFIKLFNSLLILK